MAKKYQIEPPQLGIYITPETREAIKETAGKRDKERIAEIEKHLHDELDKCLRMIAVHEITGKDFIIFTPERAIGKTRALLELCVEYGALYVTEQREINFLEREARLGYTDLPFMTISAARREGLRIRTVLKSECVKLEKVREKFGSTINIIGIEEI
jgi:hypothetical protein